MRAARRAHHRWTLADLIDFEAILASVSEDEIVADRLYFARDIRPQLGSGDERMRRRQGLWLWLAMRRERSSVDAGRLWHNGIALLRLALFVGMAVAGFVLAAGLCVGVSQAVHVIVFFGLALVLPWGVFLAWSLARRLGSRRRVLLERGLSLAVHLARRSAGKRSADQVDIWRERLLDGSRPRQALSAALGGTLQRGGLGFSVGLLLAFLGCLMVFDVRFYWEATPQTGKLMQATTEAIAMPWQWAWPAAVPDAAAIEASRARYVDGIKRVPGGVEATAAWWRFLLMSIVVWGLLPRLLLIALYQWRQRRALAGLDFQAPRHRALWRTLTAVERGTVAPESADGALLLDVGGSGIHGQDIRGFLLRALRVNPQEEQRVNVLDEAAENAADAALAKAPAHVVLLVEDWGLSPRQAYNLHARVREAAGSDTPMTWVVLGVRDGQPTPPDAAHLERWTRFIDGLRDPATEILGYAPGA
ncbi:DUF2868 domain-containing protein [Salinisphaera aquimarina]|uniref:DUF2868 domain-containing protein n=1 Tax=Salinisphaera aquimarina TaxID=2094031 RepID=A0ABV7EQR6_9GAMM